jgi:myo-inositol-1(or 4)-monophosphatase
METMDLAIAAVKSAGERVLASGAKALVVKQKGVADYVTQIDYDIQQFLVSELSKIDPLAAIVTEESEEDSTKVVRSAWLLDPIDGTTNLLHHYPYFAISLALWSGDNVALGIVYNPLMNELFKAKRGEGAFLNGSRIVVSNNRDLRSCVVGVGLPYDRRKAHAMFGNIERVFMKCQDIRRGGSASLDLAYVACGRTDGYFEVDLQGWDYSAGMLILREAGGMVSDWHGARVSTYQRRNIVASNGHIHQQLLGILSA